MPENSTSRRAPGTSGPAGDGAARPLASASAAQAARRSRDRARLATGTAAAAAPLGGAQPVAHRHGLEPPRRRRAQPHDGTGELAVLEAAQELGEDRAQLDARDVRAEADVLA